MSNNAEVPYNLARHAIKPVFVSVRQSIYPGVLNHIMYLSSLGVTDVHSDELIRLKIIPKELLLDSSMRMDLTMSLVCDFSVEALDVDEDGVRAFVIKWKFNDNYFGY